MASPSLQRITAAIAQPTIFPEFDTVEQDLAAGDVGNPRYALELAQG
ncbi:MAG: hypothetical protein AAF609_11060 [Cyanobacteria bacterium P01_C01_bin.120]